MTGARRLVALAGLAGGVLLVVGLLGVATGWWLAADPSPGEGSVDVGFARDMGVHHDQAVELAELVRERTDDPTIVQVAKDIALTQQAQIGELRGWLDVWGRRPTSAGPPMQWMGHPADEPMPGLASDDEIAALTVGEGVEAEKLFLELMIRHHEGGIHMAEYAATEADEPFVRTLAHGMVEAQSLEIDQMTDLLAERGVRYGDAEGP